jgi:hypothetical protein
VTNENTKLHSDIQQLIGVCRAADARAKAYAKQNKFLMSSASANLNTLNSVYIIYISSKMLAHVTIINVHQLQQNAQPRREARVCYSSEYKNAIFCLTCDVSDSFFIRYQIRLNPKAHILRRIVL